MSKKRIILGVRHYDLLSIFSNNFKIFHCFDNSSMSKELSKRQDDGVNDTETNDNSITGISGTTFCNNIKTLVI